MKLLLAITLLAAPAFADAKYTRKQNVQIPVNLSDRVKPIAPVQTAAPKPVVTADDMMRVHAITQPYRKEQEEILAKLIAETPDDDPDKPDLMFRLAEQYAQQLRFWRLKSVDLALEAQRTK